MIYIYEGHKEWEGTKDDIFTSTNERLNNFIFASDLLRKVKDLEVQSMRLEDRMHWKLGIKTSVIEWQFFSLAILASAIAISGLLQLPWYGQRSARSIQQ